MNHKTLIVILMILFSKNLFSQNILVINVKGKYATINVGTNDGIKKDQKYIIKRRFANDWEKIGTVNELIVKQSKAFVENLNPEQKIEIGDCLFIKNDSEKQQIFNELLEYNNNNSDFSYEKSSNENSFGQNNNKNSKTIFNLCFSVNPGNLVNSAYIGLRIKNLVAFAGTDLIWMSVSGEYLDEDYNNYYSDYSQSTYEYNSIETLKLSGNSLLIIPHAGMKIFLGNNNVKPYLLGNIFVSIPLVSVDTEWKEEYWEYKNEQLIYHYIDSDSYELKNDDKEIVKNVLSFWGMTLGAGAEYFFSKNFSIGGEYGIRLLLNEVKHSKEDQYDYGINDKYTEKWDGEIAASFKISYAVFSLNYYF